MFCEHCGAELDGAGAPLHAAGPTAEGAYEKGGHDDGGAAYDADAYGEDEGGIDAYESWDFFEPGEADYPEPGLLDEEVFEPIDLPGPDDSGAHAVDAITRDVDDFPLVDPTAGPVEPRLGAGRIAVIAVIAILFAAALLLLAVVALLHVLGF